MRNLIYSGYKLAHIFLNIRRLVKKALLEQYLYNIAQCEISLQIFRSTKSCQMKWSGYEIENFISDFGQNTIFDLMAEKCRKILL